MAAAASATPALEIAGIACPACHTQLAAGSVFCIGCGHDLRTGKSSVVKVVKSPKLRPGVGTSTAGRGSARGNPAEASPLYGPLVSWTLGLIAGLTALIAVGCAIAGAIAGRGLALPVVLGSLIGALLWFYIGPWWFRVRVGWAGGDADGDAGRSAYFVSAIPSGLFSAMVALMRIGANPLGESDLAISIVGSAVGAISIVWLFWIAREAFGANTIGGILLLIVLPLALQVALIVLAAAIFAAAVLGGASGSNLESQAAAATSPGRPPSSADLQTQVVTLRPSPGYPFGLEYPSTWKLEYLPVEEEGVSGVMFTSPDGSAISIHVSDAEIELQPWFDSVVEAIRAQRMQVGTATTLNAFGNRLGAGREFKAHDNQRTIRVRHLMSKEHDRWILIESVVGSPDQSGATEATERIAGSITLLK